MIVTIAMLVVADCSVPRVVQAPRRATLSAVVCFESDT